MTEGTVVGTDPAVIAEMAKALEKSSPEEILEVADQVCPSLVFACSFGAEDVALLAMLAQVAPKVPVFYLDTGVLFPETYALREELTRRYPFQFVQVLPELTLDEQAKQHGEALWAREPDSCCEIRKVRPLSRTLAQHQGWITGIRRAQSPTRASAQVMEWDARFGILKVNPLATWTDEQVWDYIRLHDVPYNPLHDEGYPSIGCTHCTRPVAPGADPRSGRWASFSKTECGLHK